MALTKVSSGLISADASSVDLNIDAGTLYIDSTNNRVGIGNTSPNTKLDISGNVALNASTVNPWRSSQTIIQLNEVSTLSNYTNLVTALHHNSYIDSGNTTRYIETGQEVYTLALNSYDNGLIFSTAAAGTAGDAVSLSEKFRITTGGNVGIGASSPSSLLHLEGDNPTFTFTSGPAIDNNPTIGEIKFVSGDNSTNSAGEVGSIEVIGIGTWNGAGNNAAMTFNLIQGLAGTTSPIEAMRIDNSGNVGIGTDSPNANLEVANGSDAAALILNSHATSQGATSRIQSIRADFTGSTSAMAFSTNDGTSLVERMRIQTSGNVGIGTTSPSAKLHVDGDGSWIRHTGYGQILDIGNWSSGLVRIESTGAPMYIKAAGSNYMAFDTNSNERMRIAGGGDIFFGVTTDPSSSNAGAGFTAESGGRRVLKLATTATNLDTLAIFINGNGEVGNIRTTGSSTQFNTSSDARLKDITGEARGLEVINALNPVAYNWKADGKADEGLIAQEVENVFPQAVSEPQSNEEYYHMDYSKLVTPLIKAIQEQQEQIESLKSRIETLEANNG